MTHNIKSIFGSLFCLSFLLAISCHSSKPAIVKGDAIQPLGPHIVFVTGDDEYRSEESMPMLAKILQRELDAKISMCYAVNKDGYIDPSCQTHINNLESLKTADLMVMFTRFRALPDDELKLITDYVESGKPIVGFRTSTHAFLYKDDTTKQYYNNTWPTKVFGQQWITHHGHFDDGAKPLTQVTLLKPIHPILKSVNQFDAYSWLYHVHGGDWRLPADCVKLLQGRALKTNHGSELQKYPLTNPVAWTKSYTGTSGKEARVFFTTLGHPYDFKNPNMRRLAVQGMFWALGMENEIPSQGIDVNTVGEYNPSNSGMEVKYLIFRKP